ncbi:MAG: hypothetical protein MK198_13815 [Gracilimonas sp.]|uniref:helix-turn-helix domain-containing protein n=1 Tax=Gracilimonas sp. TaxID=1974203 RepID=UPI003752C27F|nr:hypothetical protein [Gracilimonas sp.]
MKNKRPILLPKHERVLKQVGEQFKLARLRRKLSMEHVSERANIAKSTLWRIEKGDPGVAMGNYYQVLIALSLDKDILQLASDDIFGRKLQDIELMSKKKVSKRNKGSK